MNFEKMKRWKKTRFKVPAITVFKDHAEVSEMVDRDHLTECAKHNPDGIFK
jgi:5-bromo-4-chloroindolyl phosphate hydrolysis protein